MTLYFVLDARPEDRQLALYDSFGKYHLARASGGLPAVGAELRGGPPFPGCTIQDASPTGEVFGVVFERVDCGWRAARLHDQGQRPGGDADFEAARPAITLGPVVRGKR